MTPEILAIFTRSLIGNVPTKGRALFKGIVTGAVMFAVFEFISFVNTNIPRVPVSWLMIPVTVIIEGVLLIRLAGFLGHPRRQDFYFISRLSYLQRIGIAGYAWRRTHGAFFPFTAALLVTASVLEMVLLKERTFLILAAMPCCSMFFMAVMAVIGRIVIDRRLVPVSRKDETDGNEPASTGSFYQLRGARSSCKLVECIGRLIPEGCRVSVMRNLLYLLRGEIVLTILLTTAVPVLLTVLILMIGDLRSPFTGFFTVLSVFIMSFHFTSELEDASGALEHCYWYDFGRQAVLFGNGITLLIPVLPLLVVFIVITAFAGIDLTGLLILFNFLVSFLVTVAIGAFRLTAVSRNDQETASDLMLFALIAVGCFIPTVGGVFALAAAAALVMRNWKLIHGI